MSSDESTAARMKPREKFAVVDRAGGCWSVKDSIVACN